MTLRSPSSSVFGYRIDFHSDFCRLEHNLPPQFVPIETYGREI